MILFEKYGQHQPLNRQSERYAREGMDLSFSTLADQVGGCAMVLRPLYELIRAMCSPATACTATNHGAGAGQAPDPQRSTMDLRARRQAVCRPRSASGGVLLFARPDRRASRASSTGYAGILQADAYAGFIRLYAADRRPGPITEASCWAHGRRKFFELADVAAKARGQLSVPAPLAVEAVKRIDTIFDIEREINGRSIDERLAMRRERVAPLVSDSRPGCGRTVSSSRATTMSARRWTTCSSAGPPLRASSTTDGFA